MVTSLMTSRDPMTS